MIAELATAYTGLKTALGLVKSLNAAATGAAINEVKIELQQVILDAQSALSSANEAQEATAARMRELEREVAGLKEWDREAGRYKLAEIAPGVRAYVLRPEAKREDEPEHEVCANCFAGGRHSFLQRETRFPGRVLVAVCHGCGSTLTLQGPAPAATSIPLRRG